MQQEYLMAAVVCARDGKWDMLPNEYTTFQYTATIKMTNQERDITLMVWEITLWTESFN